MENLLSELGKRVKARCLENSNGCHLWQGAKTARGYGVIHVNGRNLSTHRIACAASLGRPDMLDRIDRTVSVFVPQYVLHSCDNPICCNPEHLRLGTATENAEDARVRNRRPKYVSSLPRKLTPDSVREIRECAETWDGLCDMMKKHKISQCTINEVIKRKTYKYVE